MNVLVSAAALLAACAAFLIYDQYTYRQSLVRSLSSEARIIGSNSVSAIIFGDAQAAESTLSALSTLPHIIAACIFTSAGKDFARYTRTSGDRLEFAPGGSNDGHDPIFRSNEVDVRQPIMFQGQNIGSVLIRSDLTEAYQRLVQYLGISALVMLLSLGPVILLSSRFRRSVAAPIVELAETARMVSVDRNYSVRAAPTVGHDEIALLIEAFNNMLAQIQQRDAALQAAHNELEQRVQDRTRQLTSANRELEAFSYSVSHDLRGPLEVISGFSYILSVQHGKELDSAARQCVQQISTATRHMGELIDDLPNLSRVSTTGMHREQVDLANIANEIADQLCRQEPGRNVDSVIGDCEPVEGDARLLRIVMDNLLRNAWKYTSKHEHARIEVNCEKRRGRMVFFVRDDGAGFDPALGDRLFKPFQRLHGTGDFPGTGIGLATVQRIISRHGGEIWAEGATEKGATFYFAI
jgi:signal transduction histidine kinase